MAAHKLLLSQDIVFRINYILTFQKMKCFCYIYEEIIKKCTGKLGLAMKVETLKRRVYGRRKNYLEII